MGLLTGTKREDEQFIKGKPKGKAAERGVLRVNLG